MKALIDYPTPETDAACGQYEDQPFESWLLCESLERRLAACREALEDICARCQDKTIDLHSDDDAKGCVDDCLEWAENILSLTAPLTKLKP